MAYGQRVHPPLLLLRRCGSRVVLLERRGGSGAARSSHCHFSYGMVGHERPFFSGAVARERSPPFSSARRRPSGRGQYRRPVRRGLAAGSDRHHLSRAFFFNYLSPAITVNVLAAGTLIRCYRELSIVAVLVPAAIVVFCHCYINCLL